VHPDGRERRRQEAKGKGRGGGAHLGLGHGGQVGTASPAAAPAHRFAGYQESARSTTNGAGQRARSATNGAGQCARTEAAPRLGNQGSHSETSPEAREFIVRVNDLMQAVPTSDQRDLATVPEALARHGAKIAQAERQYGAFASEDSGDAQQVDVHSPEFLRLVELREQRDVFLSFGSYAVSRGCCEVLLREKRRLEGALPALAARMQIVDWLRSPTKNLVIQGATGSGKSTQVPQYLAEELGYGQRVICTQPRKLAATSLAARVSQEWGVEARVGHRVGGARSTVTADTVIEYCTEESLLKVLVADPVRALKGVRVIVLDEAHERTMKLDILVGRLKQLQDDFGIRIVVTSATLDEKLFVSFLKPCSFVPIAGRMYPVSDVYKPCEGDDMAAAVVDEAISIHKEVRNEQGDVLIFLPGGREVDAAKDLFERKTRDKNIRGCVAMSLFGAQDGEEQKQVLQPVEAGRRKFIFATNVAETSITIDGVRWVIDSGREKREIYDPRRNISTLKEVFISRSSAMQRRGRAGRTSSGTCVRLYSQQAFAEMQQTQTAEVLSQPAFFSILSLLRMGLPPQDFQWVQEPDRAVMTASWELLELLGAVDGGQLTPVGRLAADLQIDPHWAKLLAVAEDRGVLAQAADVVAALSVSSSFFADGKDVELRQKVKLIRDSTSSFGDVACVYGLLKQWQESGKDTRQVGAFCAEKCIRKKSMLAALSTANELRRELKVDREPNRVFLTDEEVMSLVFSGYFSNLAVRVDGGSDWRRAVYRVIPGGGLTEAVDAAVIFPGSNLTGLAQPPQFVSFVTLNTTSRVFMKGLLPIRVGWEDLLSQVNTLSPSFASHLRRQEDSLVPAEASIGEVPWCSLKGRNLAAIQEEVQNELEGTAQADSGAGTLTVWCPRKFEEKATAFLASLRTRLREELELAVQEECLGGGTRVVYGRGGKVHSILFSGEHMKWMVESLPTKTTLHSLRGMLAAHGPLRHIRVLAGQGRAIVIFPSSTAAEVARATSLSSFSMKPLSETPVQSTDDSSLKLICSRATEVEAVLAWVNQILPNVDESRVIRPKANIIKPGGYVTVKFRQGASDLREALLRVRELEQAGITGEPEFCSVVSAPPQAVEHFHGECGSGAGCRYLDCLYKHPGQGQRKACLNRDRCHRADCKFLHPRRWYGDKARLPAEEADTVLGIVQMGHAEKVTIVPESASGRVLLRIRNRNHLTVQRFRDLLLTALHCHRYEHNEASLLFTRLGAESRKAATWPGCVVEDARAQTLRVYGRREERKATVAELDTMVKTIKAQPFQRFVLRRNVVKPRGKGPDARKAAIEGVRTEVKALGASEVDVIGSILAVWASSDALRHIAGELGGRGWLTVSGEGRGQCFLCQDQFDDEVLQLRACGHRFCRDCIRGFFSDLSEDRVPLCCPMETEKGPCRRELVWDDVVAACPKLPVVQRFALTQFLKTSADAVECPCKGCDHVLQKRGDNAYCEICSETYCLPCSASEDRAVAAHSGISCARARVMQGGDEVQRHRRTIIDKFLTLQCPHTQCSSAFLDYDACAAVRCSSCKCYFCAKCFKGFPRNRVCHDHVNSCTGPTLPNGHKVDAPAGLFMSQEKFNKIRIQVQTFDVQDFVYGLGLETATAVVQAMQSDFLGRPGGDIVVDLSVGRFGAPGDPVAGSGHPVARRGDPFAPGGGPSSPGGDPFAPFVRLRAPLGMPLRRAATPAR